MGELIFHIALGWVVAKFLDGLWAVLKKVLRVSSKFLKDNRPAILSRRRLRELEEREQVLMLLVKQGRDLRTSESSFEDRGVENGSP